MQIWSEQGAAWGPQAAGKRKGWRRFGWWSRERGLEAQLQGRWARLVRQLDRECEQLRRRMERG
jgi:hypothetical protein